MAAPGNEIDLFAGGVEQTDQRREVRIYELWLPKAPRLSLYQGVFR